MLILLLRKTYVEAAIFIKHQLPLKKYTEIKKVALKLMPLENRHMYKMPMKTIPSKRRVCHSRMLKYFYTKTLHLENNSVHEVNENRLYQGSRYRMRNNEIKALG